MYQDIIDALRRKSITKALSAARILVTAHPDDAIAHRWLASALQQNGDIDEALASIEQAIALSPDNADLHVARAGLLLGRRNVEAAQSALIKATELNPNQLGSYLLQAQLALGRGDLADAERLRGLAERVAPGFPQLAAIEAMIELQRGNPDQALRVVMDGLKRAPEDEQLRYALGFVHMQKGHFAFAEQAFRRLFESNPTATSLRSLIADLVLKQGRPDEAAELMAPLLEDTAIVTPGMQRFVAQMHLASGNAGRAMPLLRSALSALPNDRAILALLVDIWQRQGDLDAGRNVLDAALAATTDAPNLWIARLALELSGSPHELPLANRWVSAMPDSLEALEAQLEAYAAVDQPQKAETIAERIVALSPGHSVAQGYLFKVLLARDPKAAVSRVQSLLEQARSTESRQLLLSWLGLAQETAGDYEAAVLTWEERSQSMAPGLLPVHRISPPSLEFPAVGVIPPEHVARPLFVWGAPGSGIERVARVLADAGAPLLTDRFAPEWSGDLLQHYDSIEALTSGDMHPAMLVSRWRANLAARGIADGNVVDWLVWWDNAFLKAFRSHLPEGVLLMSLRDPRDMLLHWLAFGAHSQMALPSANEGALWLSEMLGQVALMMEEQLYPLLVVRLEGVENDPAALTAAVNKALSTDNLQPPSSLGHSYLPSGRWRDYREALAVPFSRLTQVAVRLGYPQD